MKIARRFGLGALLGVFVLTLAFLGPASAAAPAAKKATAPPITTGPQPQCSKVTPSCGTDCTNMPFELTKCWTTPYGPAKADVVVVPAGVNPAVSTNSPNLLSCQAEGTSVRLLGTSAWSFAGRPCPAPSINTASSPTAPASTTNRRILVDINAILNQGLLPAVKQCGADGCGA